MPAKNLVKQYITDGYYHVYNRGVEKRTIFQDYQDYAVFINCLKNYLTPKVESNLRQRLVDISLSSQERNKLWHLLRLNNYSTTITLLAYCLMPNHYHFLLKQQHSERSIAKFMSSLGTRYTMYFNKKYQRTGSLFESTYKAVLVSSDSQFLELTKYIHRQAISMQGFTLQGDQPSSYEDYIGLRKTPWIHPEEVLAHFSNVYPSTSYETFVNNTNEEGVISHYTLEELRLQGFTLQGEERGG
jgi:putative transposase